MNPSREALVIDHAHKALRRAIGTPLEQLAREYLRVVVEKVKRQQEMGL
jgi:hypothetical protein